MPTAPLLLLLAWMLLLQMLLHMLLPLSIILCLGWGACAVDAIE
jgi:hypothetical protein